MVDDGPAIAKPQARRFRFGLKSIFSAMFIAALAFATLHLWIKQREIEILDQQGHGFFRVARQEHRRGAGQVLVGRWAITVPKHRYILIRSDSGVAAFKLTDDVSTGDGGVKYQWYFRPDANGDFTQAGVVSGESSVYENYLPVPGSEKVLADRGRLWIRCGPIKLEWSLGNYVYLPVDEPMDISGGV